MPNPLFRNPFASSASPLGGRPPSPFPARDVAALIALIRDRTGLAVEPEKFAALDVRLLRFLKEKGLPDLAALVERMRAQPYHPLHQECLNLFTIHETYFFRDPAPFAALREAVLPRILRSREADRELVVWCVAASTGQEPYSVAMIFDDAFPYLSAWKVRVIATDLSTEAVATARRGVYRQFEVNRGLPAPLLAKYFKQTGDDWTLDRRIAGRVEFRQANLFDPLLDLPPCDLVLMRNVLIYFEPETKRRALERVRRAMRPDGFLLLGATETSQGLTDRFATESAGGSVFLRPLRQEDTPNKISGF